MYYVLIQIMLFLSVRQFIRQLRTVVYPDVNMSWWCTASQLAKKRCSFSCVLSSCSRLYAPNYCVSTGSNLASQNIFSVRMCWIFTTMLMLPCFWLTTIFHVSCISSGSVPYFFKIVLHVLQEGSGAFGSITLSSSADGSCRCWQLFRTSRLMLASRLRSKVNSCHKTISPQAPFSRCSGAFDQPLSCTCGEIILIVLNQLLWLLPSLLNLLRHNNFIVSGSCTHEYLRF